MSILVFQGLAGMIFLVMRSDVECGGETGFGEWPHPVGRDPFVWCRCSDAYPGGVEPQVLEVLPGFYPFLGAVRHGLHLANIPWHEENEEV